MSKVGQVKRITQNRIVQLVKNQLHYDCQGNCEERDNNSNIKEVGIRKYLQVKYREKLINEAIFALNK